MESKVSDFQNEPGVNNTVAGFEIPMRAYFTVVQIMHRLEKRGKEGHFKGKHVSSINPYARLLLLLDGDSIRFLEMYHES